MAERLIRQPEGVPAGITPDEEFSEDDLSPVAKLLMGQDNDPQSSEDAVIEPGEGEAVIEEPGESDTPDEPGEGELELSIDAIAKRAGITVDELFDTVKVTVGDQAMALSEFKGRLQDVLNAEELVAKAQTRKAEVGNEIMRQNQAYQQMLSEIGHQPTEEQRKRAEDNWNQYVAVQDNLLLQSIPEWEDSKQRVKDVKAYAGTLADYGFTDPEVDQFVDARLVKLAHDYTELKARLDNAQKQVVKTVRAQKPARRRQSPSATIDNVRRAHKEGRIGSDQAILAELLHGVQPHGEHES